MKTFLILLIFTTSALPIYGQRQFSVVCNTRTQTLEVIIMGEEQAFHKVLRDKFPNQKAAQTYLNENAATLPCGTRQQTTVTPPPVAVSPQAGKPQAIQAQPQKGKTGYDRTFKIGASLSALPNLENLFGSNVESAMQMLGYDIGFDLTFGRSVKAGVGLHYTGLFGVFEEILLDDSYNLYDTYGYLRAAKGELLLRAPYQFSRDVWAFMDYGIGYYFETDFGVEKEMTEMFIPQINDWFLGMRWAAGLDIFRVILQLEGEIILGISEDLGGNLFVFRMGVGYAF